MEDMAKELTLEMLENSLYREIAEAIGTERLVRLAEVAGGSTIYIPKAESLIRPVRDAHIKKEFNGYNEAELAKKYGVSVRWVRQICGDGVPMGQYSLFDYLEDVEKGDGN